MYNIFNHIFRNFQFIDDTTTDDTSQENLLWTWMEEFDAEVIDLRDEVDFIVHYPNLEHE